MRKLLLVVVAAAVGFMAAGRAAQATPEDDIATLQAQVKALFREVGDLQKQIEELNAKVAALEGQGGGAVEVRPVVPPIGPPKPPPVEPPKPPVIPPIGPPKPPVIPPIGPPKPPVPVPSAAAGTYNLDMEAYALGWEKLLPAMVDQNMPGATPEQKAQQVQAALQAVRQGSLSMNLAPDGTFTVTGTIVQPINEQGTWKQDGNVITFTTTRQGGMPVPEPATKAGILSEGKIVIEAGPDFPVEMVFVRC